MGLSGKSALSSLTILVDAYTSRNESEKSAASENETYTRRVQVSVRDLVGVGSPFISDY